jgi:hypothetical protein
MSAGRDDLALTGAYIGNSNSAPEKLAKKMVAGALNSTLRGKNKLLSRD